MDEPLGGRAVAAAASLAAALPHRCAVLSSPALRCMQTAQAAGLSVVCEPRLRECDFGRWAGSALADVHAGDPRGVEEWMRDPDAAPHGGESLRAFAARVAGWLDEEAERDGTAAAITHGGVVKAAVVHALGAPLAAFWRIDAAPLTLTELHAHDGRWTVATVNCPLDDAARLAQSRAWRGAGAAAPVADAEAARGIGEAGPVSEATRGIGEAGPVAEALR
jgi:broad specificity phosphatase PhoE